MAEPAAYEAPISLGLGSCSDLAMAILCLTIFALGTILNVTLLYGILKDKLYRSSTNLYIMNLAVTDIMIAVGILFFPTLNFVLSSWPFGAIGCTVFEVIRDCVTPVTLLTLTALSIERCKAVSLIGSTKIEQQQDYKTGVVIMLMWVASVVSLIPITMLGKWDHLPIEKVGDEWICILDRYEYLEPKLLVVIRCTITYQIPLFIIAVNYCIICWKLFSISNRLGKYRDAPAMYRSSVRAQSRARLIFLLILVFIFCSFPCHFFLWIFYLAKTDVQSSNHFWDNWRVTGFYLFYVYPILNPIFLYFTSDQYKNLFDKYLFCCKKDRTSRASMYADKYRRPRKGIIFRSKKSNASTRTQVLELSSHTTSIKSSSIAMTA